MFSYGLKFRCWFVGLCESVGLKCKCCVVGLCVGVGLWVNLL